MTIAIVVLLVSGFAIWQIRSSYEAVLASVRADNKDLRDRLFAKNGQAPSGIDLTEKFEERQQELKQRQIEPKIKSVKDFEKKMTLKDRKLANG